MCVGHFSSKEMTPSLLSKDPSQSLEAGNSVSASGLFSRLKDSRLNDSEPKVIMKATGTKSMRFPRLGP